MALTSTRPLLPTPKRVSTGTLSKPTGNGPKPSGLVPKLAAPTVVKPHPRGPLGGNRP